MGSVFSRHHPRRGEAAGSTVVVASTSPDAGGGRVHHVVTKTSKKNAVYVLVTKGGGGNGAASTAPTILDVTLDVRLFDRQVASLLDDHGVSGAEGDVLFGLNGLSPPAAQSVTAYLSSPEFGNKMVNAMVRPPPPFSASFGMDDVGLRSLPEVRLSVAGDVNDVASPEEEYGDTEEASRFAPRVRRQPKCVVRHDPLTDALTVRLPSVLVTPTAKDRSDRSDRSETSLDVHAAVVMAHNLSLAFPHGLVPILDPRTLTVERLTERLDLDVTTLSLGSPGPERGADDVPAADGERAPPRSSLMSMIPFVRKRRDSSPMEGGSKRTRARK